MNNVRGIQYSRGYHIHSDTGSFLNTKYYCTVRYVTGSEKTPLIAQKIKIVFITPVESPKHADYTAALSVVIAHSFPEL